MTTEHQRRTDAGVTDVDAPPGQEEMPHTGTTIGSDETAPEEIGESG